MNKQLDINSLEFVLGQMKTYQKEHPKATIVYDIEQAQILITYPLPPDFDKVSKLRMMTEKWSKDY